jgi:hypothetical protein
MIKTKIKIPIGITLWKSDKTTYTYYYITYKQWGRTYVFLITFVDGAVSIGADLQKGILLILKKKNCIIVKNSYNKMGYEKPYLAHSNDFIKIVEEFIRLNKISVTEELKMYDDFFKSIEQEKLETLKQN